MTTSSVRSRYSVYELLGSGGYGFVFAARDTVLGRSVALKVMRRSMSQNLPDRKRFMREASAVAALTHDHVVEIYDVGEFKGVPYLSMPLLEGESLEKCLKRETVIEESECVRIGRQIASALSAAHAIGLIHRDIKPANVWLESELCRVKLLDFGLARDSEQDSNVTEAGEVLGTPAYMSPEQVHGKPLDCRSDLFGLGVLIYQMRSGVLPFWGASRTATMIAITEEDAAELSELKASTDPRLSKLVESLLAKEPQQRPESADEVMRILTEIESTPRSKPLFLRQPRQIASTLTMSSARPKWVAALALMGMVLYASGFLPGIENSNSISQGKRMQSARSQSKPHVIEHNALATASDTTLAVGEDTDDVLAWVKNLAAHCEGVDANGKVTSDIFRDDVAITKIVFHGAQLTDENLSRLATLPTLKTLILRAPPLTGRGIQTLGTLPNLSYLLVGDLHLTTADMQPLVEQNVLGMLVMENTTIDVDAILALQSMTSLYGISCYGSTFTDESVAAISKLKHITYCDFKNVPKLSATAFKQLARLPKLRYLFVSQRTIMNAQCILALRESPMRQLDFRLKKVDAATVVAMARLPNLRRSSFRRVELDPTALESMQRLKQLESLTLAACGVSDEQAAALRQALPNCSITVKETD